MSDAVTYQIYHVGYRGWSIAGIAERVRELDAVLVDVRYSTGMPGAHWSAARFTEALGKQYRWIKSLGNRNYRDSDAPIVLVNEATGLQKLEHLIHDRRVVIMCACADYQACHRRTVIEKLAARLGGIQVKELVKTDKQGTLW